MILLLKSAENGLNRILHTFFKEIINNDKDLDFSCKEGEILNNSSSKRKWIKAWGKAIYVINQVLMSIKAGDVPRPVLYFLLNYFSEGSLIIHYFTTKFELDIIEIDQNGRLK